MNIYEELRKSKHKNNNEFDKEWTVADLVRVFKEKVPDIKIDLNKINRIENGTQKPDVDLLKIIMKAFAPVKLQECPAGCLIVPWSVSITLFHGRKDMD